MAEIDFKWEGTERQIAEALRTQANFYDQNPLTTWRWWSGFIWGAIVVASLDFGDVWVCVGDCNQSTQQAKEPTP